MPTNTPHYANKTRPDDENCDRKILKKFSTSKMKALFLKISSYRFDDSHFYSVFADKKGYNSLKGVNFQNDYISCKSLIYNITFFK